MANPHRSELNINVDNVVYTLVYDWDSICQIEKAIGLPISQALSQGATGSAENCRNILYHGLRKKHPDITLKQAGDMIPQMGGLNAMTSVISEAFSLAFPDLPDALKKAREEEANPMQPSLAIGLKS